VRGACAEQQACAGSLGGFGRANKLRVSECWTLAPQRTRARARAQESTNAHPPRTPSRTQRMQLPATLPTLKHIAQTSLSLSLSLARSLARSLALSRALSLYDRWQQIGRDLTNSDGRCPQLLSVDYKLTPGIYRCTFDTAAYYGLSLDCTPHYNSKVSGVLRLKLHCILWFICRLYTVG
jgi:hypothetical protein